MAKFLWACWDGGGNLPPSLGIARALRERGHDVLFAGRAEMLARVEAAGFATRELAQAYTLIDRYAPGPQVRIFGYLSSPLVGEELLSVVGEETPDGVVIDAMFSAALAMAPRFGIPTAAVVHTFLRRMFGAWRGNLQMQSDMRVQAGFAPLPPIDELWGGRDLVHVNTLHEFDGDDADPWPQVRHGAPVLAEETRAIPPSLPWAEDDPTPLVLLSFSTVYEQRSADMLQRALDALAPLPVRIVATTADIDPASLSSPGNAHLLPYASHGALMRRARMVVTHGGHGTAMRSLLHGLPMVLTPALAGDQPFVGRAIQEWGAGRALGRNPEVAELREAAQAILETEDFHAAAGRLSARLAGTDGAARAADALESIIRQT